MPDDIGLVALDFVGVADPLLATIARVRESLTGLTNQVHDATVRVVTTSETAATNVVVAEGAKRTRARKAEVT